MPGGGGASSTSTMAGSGRRYDLVPGSGADDRINASYRSRRYDNSMTASDLEAILRRAGMPPDSPVWNVIGSKSSWDVKELAARLNLGDETTAIVRALANESSPVSRGFALELAAALPLLNPTLVPWLRPVLRDRRVPRSALLDGAAALIRTIGDSDGVASRVMRDFAAGYGRRRVLAHTEES